VVAPPGLHKYDVPFEAVNVVILPLQRELFPVIDAGGFDTVKFNDAPFKHALPQLSISVFPSVPGLTVKVYVEPVCNAGLKLIANWEEDVPQFTPEVLLMVNGPPGPVRVKSLPLVAIEGQVTASDICSVRLLCPQGANTDCGTGGVVSKMDAVPPAKERVYPD
jgi:hypothetical protein